MQRKRNNYKPSDYHQLFKQGYNYQQVASKLGVHASSAHRQYSKYLLLQNTALQEYLPQPAANVDELHNTPKNYQQGQLEQDVLDYEAMRIQSLYNLYSKLNQAVLLDNTKAIKAYSQAITKLNEPLSTLANIKGIKS